MARPLLEIDPLQVAKLANLGAKTTEIADFFGCSPDTIQRRFAAELTKGRAQLKINLRAWQIKAAEKLNPTMLIWLGKQLLEQREPEKSIATIEAEAKAYSQLPPEQLDALRKMHKFK